MMLKGRPEMNVVKEISLVPCTSTVGVIPFEHLSKDKEVCVCVCVRGEIFRSLDRGKGKEKL